MAKVSVVIPVYNGTATISRALASVFAQSYSDYEVVVLADGCAEDAAAVVAGCGDRVRIISQPNRGLPGARNAGVRVSGGEYVAFLDDDDEWMPQKLVRSATVLVQGPNFGLG